MFIPLQKVQNSESSVIELTGLDVGESYCFYVQAYIPSRSTEKQLGEQSSTQCSNDDKQSIFDGEQKKNQKIKYNSNTVLSKCISTN